MNFIFGFILVVTSIFSLFSLKRKHDRLQIFNLITQQNNSTLSLFESKLDEHKVSLWQSITKSMITSFKNNYILLIDNLPSKMHLVFMIFAGTISGVIVNHLYLGIDNIPVVFGSAIFSIWLMLFIIKRKVKKQFYETFPEALSTIIGVISSGSSISVAFQQCAKMDGSVGRAMKEVSARMEVGENPHNVLFNSYRLLPFNEYYFFVLTVMVNLDGGGELKDVLTNLSKVLTSNAALAKIRDGKTAELRMTLMILSLIPPGFILLLKTLAEENYELLVNTDGGHYILYYVAGSVLLGILFIKKMINKVI
ncbi:hypothetical protein DKK76_06385 [Frischella perrara]|uniref:Type II secretion system protein GspF domain-containing protein n=1 Tax=Frischella perrara TaxID=1267021 RepID=A0A318MWD6_FRIPE|nr:type II secretion system F family protein [Frischella perrara]PXY95403.1 hypothetical protein DKK76_06385 [Frischella perrara]